MAPINVTRHQLMTLCNSICADEKEQILEPMMGSEYYCHMFHSFHILTLLTLLFFPFSELDNVLNHLRQGVVTSGRHVPDTKDSSGDESKVSQPRRLVSSKRTYKVKIVLEKKEVDRFFVTSTTDSVGKSSHYNCCICRKGVSVLTHALHETLRHLQGAKHFPGDQRLRMETPSWRELDFEEKTHSLMMR